MSFSYKKECIEFIGILTLEGDFDAHQAVKLRDEITHFMDHNHIQHVIVELSNVSFMDSSGIGFILARYRQLHPLSGKVFLCGMSEHLEKLFTLSGMWRCVHRASSVNDALQQLEVNCS